MALLNFTPDAHPQADRSCDAERSPPALDPLWRTGVVALDAAAGALPEPGSDAADIWQAFLDGHLTIASAGFAGPRACLIGRISGNPDREVRSRFTHVEAPLLVRVLCGDQQKAVALDLGVACSTASKWQAQALGEIQWNKDPLPLPLVIAAQIWAGAVRVPRARSAPFTHQGRDYAILGVPRPRAQDSSLGVGSERHLTVAEQKVACLLVEGFTRAQIAAQRRTSQQTIACQLRNIYFKYRLRGRYALTRRAAELGWFA